MRDDSYQNCNDSSRALLASQLGTKVIGLSLPQAVTVGLQACIYGGRMTQSVKGCPICRCVLNLPYAARFEGRWTTRFLQCSSTSRSTRLRRTERNSPACLARSESLGKQLPWRTTAFELSVGAIENTGFGRSRRGTAGTWGPELPPKLMNLTLRGLEVSNKLRS